MLRAVAQPTPAPATCQVLPPALSLPQLTSALGAGAAAGAAAAAKATVAAKQTRAFNVVLLFRRLASVTHRLRCSRLPYRRGSCNRRNEPSEVGQASHRR